MSRQLRIRTVLLSVITAVFSAGTAAQPMQWEALTDFHAGSCRNAIDIGQGTLLLSLPVTKGYDFRGILRYETGNGNVSDMRPTNAPIRSFDTTGTGRLFCATEAGMFFSDNGGQDWLADPQLGTSPTYHVRTLRGRTFAIADSGFVFLYDHALGQWERLGRVVTWISMDPRSSAFHGLTEDAGGRLFLSCSDGSINGWWTLQMSLDSGKTWEAVRSFPAFISSHASKQQDGLLVGNGTKLWRAFESGMTYDSVPGVNGTVTGFVEQNDGTLYLGMGEHVFPWLEEAKGPVGVMKSSDGGDSWTWLREGIPVQHLAFMQDGRLLCSTSGHGFLLMDPATGDTSRMPLSYGNVTDMLVTPAGVVYAAVDSMLHLEVHSSADNGSAWLPCRSGIISYEIYRPRMILDAQNRLTLGAGKWRRSTDGGDSFTGLNVNWRGVVVAVTQAGEWMTIWNDPYPTDSTCTFAYSNDDGQNWLQTKIPFIAAHPWTDGPFDLDEVEPGYLLASGTIGLAFRQGPQGSPWSRVGRWKPTDIIRAADGTVYTGTRDTTSSLIRSTDHGVTWQSFAILDSLAMRDALHADGGVLAATARQFTPLGEVAPGTGGGLYFSSDLVNWTDVGAGLPTKDIACLARDSAGYLYAGTRGFGVYRSVLQYSAEGPAVLAAEVPLPVNSGIGLHIYPQPASGNATVHCLLPSAGSLTLGLYDMLGRQLAVLSDGRQFAAGLHHFRLDLARFAAGTYVLHATAAQGRVTTRLLVRTR